MADSLEDRVTKLEKIIGDRETILSSVEYDKYSVGTMRKEINVWRGDCNVRSARLQGLQERVRRLERRWYTKLWQSMK